MFLQEGANNYYIQSYLDDDLEDVGYVQIAYGKVIRSPNMRNGKTFTKYYHYDVCTNGQRNTSTNHSIITEGRHHILHIPTYGYYVM